MSQDPRSVAWFRRWRWPLAATVCLVAAVAGWMHLSSTGVAPSQIGPNRTAAQAAPVHVAVVEKTAFPIVLGGLGTVQATNTVTVRSRVDGQIEKVGFEEGQMVTEGDLLVQIDPAPYRATLSQAIAKLAQDRRA